MPSQGGAKPPPMPLWQYMDRRYDRCKADNPAGGPDCDRKHAHDGPHDWEKDEAQPHDEGHKS